MEEVDLTEVRIHVGELQQAGTLLREAVVSTSDLEDPMPEVRQHGSQRCQPGSYACCRSVVAELSRRVPKLPRSRVELALLPMDLSNLTKQPCAIAFDSGVGQQRPVARQGLFKVALEGMQIAEGLGNAGFQSCGVRLRRAREQLQDPLEQLEGSLV